MVVIIATRPPVRRPARHPIQLVSLDITGSSHDCRYALVEFLAQALSIHRARAPMTTTCVRGVRSPHSFSKHDIHARADDLKHCAPAWRVRNVLLTPSPRSIRAALIQSCFIALSPLPVSCVLWLGSIEPHCPLLWALGEGQRDVSAPAPITYGQSSQQLDPASDSSTRRF
jgi:hypothetical protein